MRFYLVWLFFACLGQLAGHAQRSRTLLEQGWKLLEKDYDGEALRLFVLAYTEAKRENNLADMADALLHMGICSYSISYRKGLEYSFMALEAYKKLEAAQPSVAQVGRCRTLQLISTIYGRQGKLKEAIALSRQALPGFRPGHDSTGSLGLIYHLLGSAYQKLQQRDSAAFYFRKSMDEHLQTKKWVYLPSAYLSVAEIELENGDAAHSLILFQKSMALALQTENRQAQVSSKLGLARWWHRFHPKADSAEKLILLARALAHGLSDRSFYIQASRALFDLRREQKRFGEALDLHLDIQAIQDSLYSIEKQQVVRSLEVQFQVSEKDRLLRLAESEKEVARLTNWFLWSGMAILVLVAGGTIGMMRRINKRDRQLIAAKEKLMAALEQERMATERQMQQDLEFKESQLTALTLQMLQKNEWMQELKSRVEEEEKQTRSSLHGISRIIQRGLSQDKDWNDFNTQFEQLNHQFYVRLKQAYPEISPNDLKLCALIKLNLSIKEMAGILNISADSVKTARYRLRKKLQLNTEDNLTDFILQL